MEKKEELSKKKKKAKKRGELNLYKFIKSKIRINLLSFFIKKKD